MTCAMREHAAWQSRSVGALCIACSVAACHVWLVRCMPRVRSPVRVLVRHDGRAQRLAINELHRTTTWLQHSTSQHSMQRDTWRCDLLQHGTPGSRPDYPWAQRCELARTHSTRSSRRWCMPHGARCTVPRRGLQFARGMFYSARCTARFMPHAACCMLQPTRCGERCPRSVALGSGGHQ